MSSLSPNRSPRVAMLGRPNVGKSTLFNYLTRSRKALVRDEPGVTRDLLIEPTEWWGSRFDVVDTGGITDGKEGFSPYIREQVLGFLKNTDLLLVIMDAKSGLVPEDRDIIRIAKESGKSFLLIINKVDVLKEAELKVAEFYEFGVDVVATSFEQSAGVDQIVEWVIRHLPRSDNTERTGTRLAMIGKPNVGKSSLCNRLLGEKRMLVSPIAGTTVDSVEAEFVYAENNYTLVDTAGLRRAARRKDGVEYISAVMSENSIHYADIVLLVVDVVLGPSEQDAKLLEMCLEKHKAVIVVANKCDLGEESYTDEFRLKVEREFVFFPDVPVVFVSAKTGFGLPRLFKKIEDLKIKLGRKISTSSLNDFFFATIRKAPAPVWGNRNVKFYYLTQTGQSPPSFIAFANHPQGVTPAYRRFLAKQIQENFDLKGVPIRIFVMPRKIEPGVAVHS